MTNTQIKSLYRSLVHQQRACMETIDIAINEYQADETILAPLKLTLVTLNRRIFNGETKFPWLKAYYTDFYFESNF